jgi:predicted nucleic acid-binding protein
MAMNSKIIIDTDILIDVGQGVATALARLKTEASQSTLVLSIITRMELLVGCQNKTEMCSLERFLKPFEIIPLRMKITPRNCQETKFL